ncbi:hypothetical protein MVI01_56870 [Myxococcus virescens]|uniref:Uncharacterized protein n=1 Tax=Myxococcus virescens TaxID=83456 RepID=A0A511HK01_9BACT|nr:hypothetical protein MVI01_56870 [Myxococcus virescens]
MLLADVHEWIAESDENNNGARRGGSAEEVVLGEERWWSRCLPWGSGFVAWTDSRVLIDSHGERRSLERESRNESIPGDVQARRRRVDMGRSVQHGPAPCAKP